MAIDGAVGERGGRCDVAHRNGVVTALDEEAGGNFEQLLARPGRFRGARRRGRNVLLSTGRRRRRARVPRRVHARAVVELAADCTSTSQSYRGRVVILAGRVPPPPLTSLIAL